MTTLLEQLNPVQRQAVRHKDGPLLVLAGAGSGKTRIITYRVAYLIEQGVLPQQILAVTFTNKAAQEMCERVGKLLGVDNNPVWVATIHASCARILRREIEALDIGISSDFTIADTSDQSSILRRCMKECEIDKTVCKPSFYKQLFGQAVNSYPKDAHWEKRHDFEKKKIKEIYELYRKNLIDANMVDFNDLLMYTYEVFSQFPDILARYQRRWKYQMVDEFQDINAIQYEIIKMLAAKHNNLFVVGDDDQSIYKWRGADVKNILYFDDDFKNAEVILLEQNYRSTKTIIEASSNVCKVIKDRREKSLWTENKQGPPIDVYVANDEYDEARFIIHEIRDYMQHDSYDYSDFAVLYRTNAQSRVLEEVFTKNSIPYYLIGEIGFYKRKEVRDLLAYLTLLADEHNNEALMRIINVPGRGIGDKTQGKIQQYAAQKGIHLYAAIRDDDFLKDLSPRSRAELKQFLTIMELCQDILFNDSLSEGLKALINSFQYLEWLRKDNQVQAESRIENISQLINALNYFEEEDASIDNRYTLLSFLEKVALSSEADDYDSNKNRVTLMTLHCAKGLEFPVVFLAGVVESLLPHSFAMKNLEEDIDEERRLCYVGMTRSRKKLYMTCPINRKVFGRPVFNGPSRFLKNIPKGLLKINSHPSVRNAFGMNQYDNPMGRPQQNQISRQNGPRRRAKIDAQQETQRAREAVNPHDKYRIGTRVRHPRWGNGVVIQLQGVDEKVKLLISFPGFGRRLVLAKIAPLEITEY